MKSIDIVKSLKAETRHLQDHFGVEELAVFGSVARGENDQNSDIDILVKRTIRTIDNYFAILDYLQSRLKRKVDLITLHEGLSSRFLNQINKHIIYV